MGLKVGVADGSGVYLDHIKVVVTSHHTDSHQQLVKLTIKGIPPLVLAKGQEAVLGEGVVVSYIGRSSTNIHRLGISAPEEVCVTRGWIYEDITAKTKGFLVSPVAQRWIADWLGYTMHSTPTLYEVLATATPVVYNNQECLQTPDHLFVAEGRVITQVIKQDDLA